jgi:hypothetical protein
MKPLATPLVPLLVIVAAVKGRARGFVLAGVGGLLAALLAFLPFLLTGRFALVMEAIFSDLGIMPYASINGHTIWWLFGGWRNVDAPWVGSLTPARMGPVLVGAAYVFLIFRSLRWMRPGAVAAEVFRANLFFLAAALTIAFFFLSTHMHENHLVMAIPLLLVVAGSDPSLARLAALCSLGSFLNMLLHSQLVAWLPAPLSTPAPVPIAYAGPYSLSWLQLVGGVANSLLLGAVAATALRSAAARGRSATRT